ncbi:unnamed protein product [Rhizophagus irregularis]|nr:unnamed protein product [Rhizophagus irregularis]
MITKTSSLLDYVNLDRIHPLVISNIIEPLSGLISPNKLSDIRKKYALLAENTFTFREKFLPYSGVLVVIICAYIEVLLLLHRILFHKGGLEQPFL